MSRPGWLLVGGLWCLVCFACSTKTGGLSVGRDDDGGRGEAGVGDPDGSRGRSEAGGGDDGPGGTGGAGGASGAGGTGGAAGAGGASGAGGAAGAGGAPSRDAAAEMRSMDAGIERAPPDGPCAPSGKLCGGNCVIGSPANGCHTASCSACPGAANATSVCSVSGACDLACNVGFADCDGNTANGCERNVQTDPANCGGCSFACANGATCTGSICQLVPPQTTPVGDLACVAVDANNVYWTTARMNGEVWSVPKAGGSPSRLAQGQATPRGIAVDANNVYWTNLQGGTVVKCPFAGCGSGGPTVLASGQSSPFSVAVDANNAYWSNFNGGNVVRCAIGGCGNQPTDVAPGQNRPLEVATDGRNVYWTNQGNGWVMQAPVAGGAAVPVSRQAAGTRGIAVDASFVYFTHQGSGTVLRAPIGGGAATPVATGQVNPWGIAVDATHVYWASAGMGMNAGSIVKAQIGELHAARVGDGDGGERIERGKAGQRQGVHVVLELFVLRA